MRDRKGARQLTVRAVVTGVILGAGMCLSNLYVLLKTGLGLGAVVTASVLGYGVFSALQSIGLVKDKLSVLENSAMGSVASAAAAMPFGGNMAAVPALLLLTGVRPDPWSVAVWFAGIAALGVFAAIPLKRQLINV